MNLLRSPIIKFSAALAFEFACCAALHFFDDWTEETAPVRFVAIGMLAGIAYWFAVNFLPTLRTAGRQALLFWAVAIGLRLAVLPVAPGDDLWRYLWEGKIQRAGFNPYLSAPEAPELRALALQFEAWPKINHREFAAVYPPGAELIFRACSALTENPFFYKVLFALADLAAVALLLQLIGGPSAYRNAAWYAWNPLVVYSFAGAAHFDSLMLLPLLAAVLFLVRHALEQEERRRWLLASLASLALGVAISIKLVPALLLLLFAFALGKRAFTLILALAVPALTALSYGWPRVAIGDSLGRFAHVTRLNDLFWWLVEDTLWSNPRQKNWHYNVTLLAVVLLLSLIFWRNWRRGLLWVFGVVIILSPVLHPWYCTWILPFATWRRARAWHVLSITLFAYYLFWNERLFLLPWRSEPWMRAIIILPPLIATILFWRAERTSRRDLPEATPA